MATSEKNVTKSVTTVLMGNACFVTVTTTTTPVMTMKIPVIDLADQSRINVNIKLTSRNYTKDLGDKTSEAYKKLKTQIMKTVIKLY